MNIETTLKQYDFNLEYAKMLIKDLTDDQMTTIPSNGLENHPAWTLGHLVSGSAGLASDLGAESEMTDNWVELFVREGPGDPRRPDLNKNKYPSKQLLISALENQHNKVKQLLRSAGTDILSKPITWRFCNFMPTIGDVVVFTCINHESMHLGQLAAWRRAMGLNSDLAAIKHRKKPYH